jgi:surfactin synthase thioesterase subunit
MWRKIFAELVPNFEDKTTDLTREQKVVIQLLLQTHINDVRLFESFYEPLCPYQGRKISSPILACHGKNDREVHISEMEEWKLLTTSGMEMCVIEEAKHLFIDQEFAWKTVLQKVLQTMKKQ